MLEDLVEHFDEHKDQLVKDLQELAHIVFRPENLMVDVTCDEKGYALIPELVKDIKKKGENTKVAIRNIRRDANDAVKKNSAEMSEDEVKKTEDNIQKLTDKYVAMVDKMVDDKSKEIMTI